MLCRTCWLREGTSVGARVQKATALSFFRRRFWVSRLEIVKTGSTGGSSVASCPVDLLDMTLAAITSPIPWPRSMRNCVRQKALRAVAQWWLMMCSR